MTTPSDNLNTIGILGADASAPQSHARRSRLATGGNPGSTVWAGQLGLPVSYGIIGGAPHRFAPLAKLYRATAEKTGHSANSTKVSVGALGLVAPTKKEALERFYPGWYNLNIEMGRLRGWQEPDSRAYYAQAEAPGAYYIGGLPHEHFMESLTLLATEVKPRVERLLAAK